jgi:hypothetical protein
MGSNHRDLEVWIRASMNRRNSKFESRSPKQARKPKTRNSKAACGREFGTFEFGLLESVSDFVFRTSDLGAAQDGKFLKSRRPATRNQ